MTDTAQTQRRQKGKMNVEIMERIMSEKKTTLSFSQEVKLEDSQFRNRKSERLIDKYPNKQHHKRYNICRSKISQWKKQGSSEDHR